MLHSPHFDKKIIKGCKNRSIDKSVNKNQSDLFQKVTIVEQVISVEYYKAISFSCWALWYLDYIDSQDLISNMPTPGGSQGVTGKSPSLHGE